MTDPKNNPNQPPPPPLAPEDIVRFLGADAMRAGPFGLLDIAPDELPDHAIDEALQRRLARIDQHPHRDAPQALQLRAALTDLARQLKDPDRQAHFRAAYAGPTHAPQPRRRIPARQPSDPTPSRTSRLDANLERDAMRLIGRFGGWNNESRRAVTMMAAKRGLTPEHVVDTLRHIATKANPDARPASAADPFQQPTTDATPDPSPAVQQLHEEARNRQRLGAGVVVAMLLLAIIGNAMLVTTLLDLRSRHRAANNSNDLAGITSQAVPESADAAPIDRNSTITEPPPTTNTPADEPAAPPEPSLLGTGREIVAGLTRATVAITDAPDTALDAFDLATRSLAQHWPDLAEGERRAANHQVIEYLYTSLRWQDHSEATLEIIASGAISLAGRGADAPPLSAEEVAPAAWSVGMLSRLRSEREIPARDAGIIGRHLAAAIGTLRVSNRPTFDDGARAALIRIPERILDGDPTQERRAQGADAIVRWRACAGALFEADRLGRERLLLDVLERVMRGPRDPSDDQRVLETVRTITDSMDWRSGGPARPSLLDWFRNTSISNDDLAELTAALAQRSSADAIDGTLVLSRSAPRDARLKLRAEYARVWGLEEAAANNDTARAWAETATALISQTAPATGTPSADNADRLLRFALLNEAARRIWRGDTDNIDEPLRAAEADLLLADALPITIRRLTDSTAGTDGQWALRYRAARLNTPVRLELLNELDRGNAAIGPIDAEVLVEEALFGSPSDRIRPRAQEIAVDYAGDPALVNGLLEALPRRRTRPARIAEFVEDIALTSLGDPKDPLWPLRARTALVERLLQLLAGSEGASARTDRMVTLLAASYDRRAGTGTGELPDLGDTGVLAAQSLRSAASSIAEALRTDARAIVPVDNPPVSLAEIDRRRQARFELAVGPPQRFATEQVAIAELTALVIAGEHRARAEQARTILDELAGSRRSAASIFEQLAHTERTILRLWLLRFGETP